MKQQGKIYFASDLHLGVPDKAGSKEREHRFVAWLEQIEPELEELYLLGDVFDFWFEYKRVVPRGYVRLLGKLASMSDQGIKISYFTGNHDMWMRDYFEEELGMKVYREPQLIKLKGKRFFIGHGDGMGPGDRSYKLLKNIFESPLSHWLYSRLHPNFALGLAGLLSRRSRLANAGYDEAFDSKEKEALYLFAQEYLKQEEVDYFVFGHRHLSLDLDLGSARYINLGQWVTDSPYAVFDGKNLELKKFDHSK